MLFNLYNRQNNNKNSFINQLLFVTVVKNENIVVDFDYLCGTFYLFIKQQIGSTCIMKCKVLTYLKY